MLDSAEIFVEVVKAGSLAGASRATGVPVSTVSDRIASLEARLQTMLLKRTMRRLILTEAGRAYFDVVRTAVEEVRQFEADMMGSAPLPTGTLRLASTLAMDSVLAPIIAAYLGDHPGVRIDLTMSARNEDLIGGQIDLAVRLGSLPDDSGLVARTLGRCALHFVASPAYLAKATPIGLPHDIAPTEVLCFTGTTTLDLHHPDGASAHIEPAPWFSSNQMSSILLQALAGTGVALLPTAFLRKELESGDLVIVLPGWYAGDMPVSAVYSRHQIVPARVRTFLDVLIARFPKDLRGAYHPPGRKVDPAKAV